MGICEERLHHQHHSQCQLHREISRLQVLSPIHGRRARRLPINLTATTIKVGFADLGHLLPNSYVEADVTLDPQGNFVGNTVEVQAVENPFPTESGVTPSTALIGPIVSIQTDLRGIPSNSICGCMTPSPTIPVRFPMTLIFQVDLTNNPTYQASVLGAQLCQPFFWPAESSRGSGTCGPWGLH